MGNSISAEQALFDANDAVVKFGIDLYMTSDAYQADSKKNVKYQHSFIDLDQDQGDTCWNDMSDKKENGRCASNADNRPKRSIYTLEYFHEDSDDSLPPMVLVHGFAQSAAQYYAMGPALANEYKGRVYVIDMFGCGLSTRDPWPHEVGPDCPIGSFCYHSVLVASYLMWSSTLSIQYSFLSYPTILQITSITHNQYTNILISTSYIDVAENYFVDALEAWRLSMKIAKLILVGHSLGGFLSAYVDGGVHASDGGRCPLVQRGHFWYNQLSESVCVFLCVAFLLLSYAHSTANHKPP